MMRQLAALAILDIATCGLCAAAGVAPGWALIGHVVLSATGYLVWLRGAGPPGVVAAVLGVFGPAGILIALRLTRRGTPRAIRSEEAIFGPALVRKGQRGATLVAKRMLDGRIHHAGPETIDSLVTILRYGDVGARRRALETVVRSFEPALSPLIALALTDSDQTIRALAAAASARVGQNLLLTRAGLTDLAADPAAASNLAALLADHARADVLLPDSQRSRLRDDALALLPAGHPTHAALAIEASWAAGDYAAIDALTRDVVFGTDEVSRDAAKLATWWQRENAA